MELNLTVVYEGFRLDRDGWRIDQRDYCFRHAVMCVNSDSSIRIEPKVINEDDKNYFECRDCTRERDEEIRLERS